MGQAEQAGGQGLACAFLEWDLGSNGGIGHLEDGRGQGPGHSCSR